jgi:hypothetical protein
MKTSELVSKYRHTFNTDFSQDVNCVACYLFQEGTGTTVDDTSSNSNTGTFKGAGEPAWDTTDVPFAVSGSAPNSVDFDGSDDFIDLGAAAALDLTSHVSIVSWVNSHSLTTQHIVFNNGTFDTRGYYFTLFKTSGNAGDGLSFVCYTGSNNQISSKYTLFNTDTWYHIAATAIADNTPANLYVNGVELTSLDVANNFTGATANTTTNAKIGSYSNNTINFDGGITETAVFNDPLTSTEINEIMDYGLKPAGGAATKHRRMLMGVGL